MRPSTRRRALALLALCGLAATPAAAQLAPSPVLRDAESRLTPGGPADATGPDVIVGEISDVYNGGAVNGIRGYAVGTTSCNIGTQNLLWISSTNQHPVIGQNIYKLKNGRLEQIGQSWLKHGFTALSGNLCGTCNGPSGSVLGVNCSDPYSGSLNAGQSRLGPRSEVNATTGFYPYPYQLAWQQTGDAAYKRCQVAETDIQDTTALYFAEGEYVTGDDAMAGNGLNNASYRRVTFGAASPYNASVTGITFRTKPAIWAWKDHGLGVGISDPSVTLIAADYQEQGLTARFWIGAKVTDLGGGQWHYEYAIFNLNSHRSAASFTIPFAGGVTATSIQFKGVPYHSGEPYSNTPWNAEAKAPGIVFESTQSFAQNPNANALRWGVMYNFRFDASVPPTTGVARLGFFRPGAPGDPDSLTLMIPVPSTGPCYADCDNAGSPALNVADFGCFLTRYAAGDPYANCDNSVTPPTLNVADFGCFLHRYAQAQGCN